MTFPELMRFLLEHDVQVSTDGRSLHYDAPDGVVTEQVLAELRRHKATLISWLASNNAGTNPPTRTLPSHIQEVYWHRVTVHPHPTVYTIARRLCFAGHLDAAALQTALDWLVARHDALRTRFSSFRDGEVDQPVQEIVARLPAGLAVTDLTALPAECRAAELERRCAEQVAEPFALDLAPLWRAQLFVSAPDRHVLLWTLQHIICDGWSLAILCDELVRAYAAARSGRLVGSTAPAAGGAGLPAVVLTYPEYARWQRRHLSGPHRERLAAFWRAEIAGSSLALPLPFDRPPPPQPSGRGAVHRFELDPTALARLRTAAGEQRSTLYVVVLSAFARLLAELTGQDDLVIPISHANRTRAEHEAVVGLLSDRIPVRIRLGGAAGTGEIVRRVGRAVFTALDHQAMPLSLLLAALPEQQRPVGFYPTVLFTLLDDADERWDLDDVLVTVQPDSADGAARMQLYCFMTVSGGGLGGGFEYATDLFDAATIAAWSDRFVALLAEAGQLSVDNGRPITCGRGRGSPEHGENRGQDAVHCLGQQEDAPSWEPVGDVAAVHTEQEGRQELQHHHHADRERAVSQAQDQPALRDNWEHPALRREFGGQDQDHREWMAQPVNAEPFLEALWAMRGNGPRHQIGGWAVLAQEGSPEQLR